MEDCKKYATAILCMDGAFTGGVRKIMKSIYDVLYVDIISQPGIVKVLAENTNLPWLDLIKKMIKISVVDHSSRAIAIAAHHNCLGNPVSKEKQLKQLPWAMETVKKMINNLGLSHLDIKYTLLWINERGLPEEVHISTKKRLFSRELVFEVTA